MNNILHSIINVIFFRTYIITKQIKLLPVHDGPFLQSKYSRDYGRFYVSQLVRAAF